MRQTLFRWGMVATLAALTTGCATPQAYDYSAFRQSQPKSILVLPPQNSSPEVKASYSMYAQVTHPLAESGYYVLPVTLVDETFRQNGLTAPGDIHAVAPAKLREVFGADAALYIDITRYGTQYQVINSETAVSATAKLVDLKTGQLLWEGKASASTAEQQNNSNDGLIGMLVTAVVTQIADTVSERGHELAGTTSERLLSAGHTNGLLYGPRSPHYAQQ